ncbi:hypothetical protein [Rhizobium sp. 18055]|uniref:TRADD-N-associated membrane domain-containing protein n=1 Tax=Rhizobium sp. 18055 TaxID=2681403 RepID=UPI001357245B|nr:hypothetical protein [Rhizobium sp. 18055]
MFEQTIETLNAVVIEVLRRNKLARGLVLATTVISAGITVAGLYVGFSGNTLGSGRAVNPLEIAPVVIAGAFVTIWCLSAIFVSLVEPERLKEVTRRDDGSERFLDALIGRNSGTFSGKAIGTASARGTLSLEPPKNDEKPKDADDDIIKGIKINLAQLVEYYLMNQSQAKSSFRASLTAVIVGFVTIICGGWWAYTSQKSDITVYVVPFAGLILQFIGGGYFYLYNRSLIQLNFFFSRLAQMQDTLLAIHLAESLTETKDKTKAIDRLITIIAERSADAPAYLKSTEKPTQARRAKAQPVAAAE